MCQDVDGEHLLLPLMNRIKIVGFKLFSLIFSPSKVRYSVMVIALPHSLTVTGLLKSQKREKTTPGSWKQLTEKGKVKSQVFLSPKLQLLSSQLYPIRVCLVDHLCHWSRQRV